VSLDPIADGALARWLARTGAPALFPPRRAAGDLPTGSPVVRDLAAISEHGSLALVDLGDATVVAPIVTDGRSFRRAVPGDGAFSAIAALVRGPTPRRGGLTVRVLERPPDVTGERGIDVDQSNESVVVGERIVVKLFPQAGRGPQPGEDLAAHLAAVGSTDVPTPFGSVRWRLPDGSSLLVATVSAFLPHARDGWAWFLELALEAIGGGDRVDSLVAAGACGTSVARLHVALATASPLLPDPLGDAGQDRMETWERASEALLVEALAVTRGAEGDRLEALAPAIRAGFAAFRGLGATPVQRIHGDLHVGQVLAGPHGYAITDLDGNPLAPASERVALQPTARDVAAFVRSLDHLGRLAQRRLPGRDVAVESWIVAVRERFLDTYRATIASAGRADRFDERLLAPFEVAQECHEYVYAARFLPRWLPVPDLAMPRLLGAGA
jgi:maltokinase